MPLDTKQSVALKTLFPNEASQRKVVDALTPSSKPDGWARRSTAAYYKECYALKIREAYDRMLTDRNDSLLRYDVWKHLSRNSLYLLVNQATRYLIDNMDTADRQYAKMKTITQVTREPEGVLIAFLPGFRDDLDGKHLIATIVIPDAETPKWKREMFEWVEGDDTKPFVKEGLMLSAEEVRDLKVSLGGADSFLASVTASTIKLLRL